MPWYEFTCPECGTAFAVDEPVRDELLAAGCIRCEATVTPAAFRRRDDAPSLVT
jgi:predicted nucleic acid-binding Zn ribbon protein